MARPKKKRGTARSKGAARSVRKPKPERKPNRKKKKDDTGASVSWGDYLGASLSPLLIMVMVACLLYFFVNTFYRGFYAERLYWIMGFFTFAVVFVSRISIQMGRVRASVYGVALAIVTVAAIVIYIEEPIPAIVLTLAIWWCAKMMTWDCTLINDEEDASGEGLLQHTGLEKRLEPVAHHVPWWKRLIGKKAEGDDSPHAPGVWILYFSLAAIPIFGFGQFLVSVDGPDGIGAGKRALSFNLLIVYMLAALGLLLVTSLLGLRRYLKQRGMQMPQGIVWTWIGTGTVLILLLMIGSYFLPRPSMLADFGPMQGFADLKFGTDYLDHEESLLKLGYDVEKDDPNDDGRWLLDAELIEEKKEKVEPEPVPEPVVKDPDKKERKRDDDADERPREENQPPEEESPEEKPPEEETLLADATIDPEQQPEPPENTDTPPEPESPVTPDPEGTPMPTGEPEPTETEPPENEATPEDATPPDEEKSPEPDEPEPVPEEPEAQSPPEPEVETAEFDWFFWLMILLIILAILVVGYLLYRYNSRIRNFFQNLWNKLFGKKPKEEEEEEKAVDELETGEKILVLAPPEPPQPFGKFRNPFADGSAEDKSNAAMVCYTFDALESWAYEQNHERPPEQTPMEFCYELERHDNRFDNSAKQLSRWYTSYAYAEREPEDSCRPELEHVWEVMLNKEEETVPELADDDDMDTTEFPVSNS